MNILHINTCPLCGGHQFKHTLTCTDHYASGEKFEVITCAHCGFMCTQDVPVEAEIGRYYETPDYISHSDTQKGMMNKVYHWVRHYMLQKKASMVEQVSGIKKGSILDIGTGTGYFSHTMKERGWKVKAIEKSAQARAFARDHFQLDVEDADTLPAFPENTMDIVTLWHVMEHLEHLNETWIKLNKILKGEGKLIIAVPNPTSYDAHHYQEMWAAYDVPRHLWHFSPEIMKQMGEKHGFALLETYPMPFDAFYVSMLTEKYKDSSLSFIRGAWLGFKAWLHAFQKKEQSSSMIYIFKKK